MTTGATARPPAWFIAATAVLAAMLLLMAVTETSLLGHYLIDQGEFVAIVGLVFVSVAGVVLYRGGRLRASVPFVLPWLIYPVITQGDQVIDNMNITWMRILTHILLVLIFAAPALVLAFGARTLAQTPSGGAWMRTGWLAWVPGLRALGHGRLREGTATLAAALFGLEFIAAHLTLGLIMIVLLAVMVCVTLTWGGMPERTAALAGTPGVAGERRTLVWLLVGVVVSAGLYVGYKNRPGAYQGSPSYLLDPAQQAAGYDIDRLPVSALPVGAVDTSEAASVAADLDRLAAALDRLVDGYYIAERNYTYDFHNELFLRSWPVLADYRRVALETVAEARRMALEAVAEAPADPATPLGALQAEVRAYVLFNLDRADVLERLTGEFERTQAGLQHAAHIYEGEGKLVGLGLQAITQKHAALLAADAARPAVDGYLRRSAAIHARYANRIVGF